jgi:hypothetical protein
MANETNTTYGYRNGTHLHECYGATIITAVAWNVFFIGLIANVVLLCLVFKKLASGRRNDKLHLLSIIVANLFSLFGSLLGEMLGRGNITPSAQIYCIYYHQVNFISLFNNLTSMAALCYILYENIVKFPGNRLFSFSLSLKITAASWILSLVLVPAAQSGFIIADKQGVGICKNNIDKTSTPAETASFFSLIVLVTIWISVCASIIRISLAGVGSKLKQHREQTRHLLQNMSLVKVVSFNKQAYVMVYCYSICWIPFGISAALTAVNVISFHSCVYFACLVGAHVSAASTPLIYLTIDKRFRIKCCRNQEATPPRRINAN